MSELKKGDRVRVTYEGQVINPSDADGDVMIKVEGSSYNRWCSPDEATVIEPAYETGTAYIDADGDVVIFSDGEWLVCGDSDPRSLGWPTRPLRKLVPEA